MARDLRGKKMPAKPMKEAMADEELELDMPMSEEEMGEAEAEEDMLAEEEMVPSPLDEVSDEELIAEMQKRGLSLEEADEEMPAPEEEMA